MKTHYFIFGQNAIKAEEELTLAAHFSPESGEVGEIVTIKPTANPHLILSSYDGYAGFKEISESEYLKIRSYLTKSYPNIDDMGVFTVIEEEAEAYLTEIGKLKDTTERQTLEINRLRTIIRQENPSKFYVLKIWADVDPILSRPMESKAERDDFALLTKKEDEEDSGIYWIDQVQGELKAGAYPGNFFEEDVPGKVEEAKLTYGSKKTEAYLNELYQNEMSLDEAFEKLVYLTNKNRGKHIHEKTLRKAIQDGDVAKYIRRLDPVAYNCTRNDLGYAEEPTAPYQKKEGLLKAYFSPDQRLIAIIYATEGGKYIAAEPSSSMGFESIDGAFKWLQFVCKGKTLLSSDPIIPKHIQQEIIDLEKEMQLKNIQVQEEGGNYQCGMFTGEQMKGTGQTNLLDLTDRVEDLKAALRKTPHKYWNDPGHAWLEVEKAHLKELGIQFVISGYSYQDGEKAYLEEDVDMTIYLQSLFGAELEHKDWDSFKTHCFIDKYKENIFIRNLNNYTP